MASEKRGREKLEAGRLARGQSAREENSLLNQGREGGQWVLGML